MTAVFYNIYRAASLYNTGRVRFGTIQGQVFDYFLFGNALQDMVYLGNIHLWPFWSADNNVRDWQSKNSINIHLQRCDGLECASLFSHSAKAGIWLDEQVGGAFPGPATNIHFASAYIEFSTTPLLITGNSCTAFFGKLTTHGCSVFNTPTLGSYGILDSSGGSRTTIAEWISQWSDRAALYLSSTSNASSILSVRRSSSMPMKPTSAIRSSRSRHRHRLIVSKSQRCPS